MSLKDIQAHLTKAQEQLAWHMEEEQQSVAEREARGEKVKYFSFEYEHGVCGTGRQDIYAYGLEDAFRRFGWAMNEFKMHPRNINYKMLGEPLSVTLDKREAEKLANELLTRYGKPDEERWTGFIGVLAEYGSEQEADKMLVQVIERQAHATINGVQFAFKNAWLEEQDGCFRVLAEYARETEEQPWTEPLRPDRDRSQLLQNIVH